jgi:hypothetical protein
MKKTVAFLSLALLLTTGVASAHKVEGQNEQLRVREGLKLEVSKPEHKDMFVVSGKIKSISGTTFVVTADQSNKHKVLVGKDVTIKTNADTKFNMQDKAITFSTLKVGNEVMIKGQKIGADYVANWVHVKADKQKKSLLMGEITARHQTP